MDAVEYTRIASIPLPAHYGDPRAELAALHQQAAVVPLAHRSLFCLSGADPAALLAAVTTNSLPDDRGAYTLLLDPKGHIQTDLHALRDGPDLLLHTEPEGAHALTTLLGRYAPFYRLGLEELPDHSALGLYGPRAQTLLEVKLEEHQSTLLHLAGYALLGAGTRYPLPGVELFGPREDIDSAAEHLRARGAAPAGLHALETARIQAAVPRFGADLTPDNFPAEARLLPRAVNLSKGCYPGQETVARMHYRGHPNRLLHRLAVEGPPPTPPTDLHQNGRTSGRLTSISPIPRQDGLRDALGYLSRRADPASPLLADEATLVHVIDNDSR